MEIEGFIFDLDGTMVDNMMIHHRAWQRTLSTLGLELTLGEVKEKVHGINEEILERLFGNRYNPEQRIQISRQKEMEYRRASTSLDLVKGLTKFLESANQIGILMGVATAAPKENVDFIIERNAITHFFRAITYAAHVSNGKPHPEVLERTAEQMGIPLNKCLVFEDSPTGAETALRAGCLTHIITTTHHSSEFASYPNVIGFTDNFEGISVNEILLMCHGRYETLNARKHCR